MATPLPVVYGELLERLDRWSADAAARHPGVIPCTRGCSACCHGPFDISPADAALLRAGLAALDPTRRSAVRARGARLLARMREVAPGWRAPYEIDAIGEDRFDQVAEALADEPCPLLGEDGGCVAYAHRPAICRMMGLGMRTPEGDVENACPIRHQYPAYAALPPQPFDLAGFERAEARVIEAAGGGETTIAAIAAE